MSNKSSAFALLSLLLFAEFAGCVPTVLAHNAPFPPTYDPTHLIIDTIAEPESLDPAWAYENECGSEITINLHGPPIGSTGDFPVWIKGPYEVGRPKTGPLKALWGLAKKIFKKVFNPLTQVIALIRGTETIIDVADGGTKFSLSDSMITLNYTGSKIRITGTGPDGEYGTDDDVVEDRSIIGFDPETNSVTWDKPLSFSVASGTPYVIDPPVESHKGHYLTPEDVEYSFERLLVQDRDGGPAWMAYEALLGQYGASDPATDPNFGYKIDQAIECNNTHVWFNLASNYLPERFLEILCQPWTSVIPKAWAIAKGDFDGDWTHTWTYIWNRWHNPDVSFIEGDENGYGPYKLSYWNQGTSWSIVKFDDYWDGWPAPVANNLDERIGGYVSRVTWNLLTSWTTRRARFLAGESDFTVVPRQYRDQVLGAVVGGAPIRCMYPITPQLAVDAEFFTFDINPQSPYLGVPSGLPPSTFAEAGIPPNIFSDIHVRRGFAAAFDYNLFLSASYLGEAEQPSDPIIVGLSYDNQLQAKPTFDLTKAATELQAAWGGQLWANGMKFTLLFNSGNVARETASTMLANNIMSLNPKFHLDVQEIAWSSTYLPQMVAGMLPLFNNGWQPDYSDPDNFAFSFMHTYGPLSRWQRYSNPRVDELIEYGALMPEDTAAYNSELDQPDPRPFFNNPDGMPPDTRWPRRSVYYELQAIYVEDIPGFCLDQAIGRHWEQAWMRGWYYNPLHGCLTSGIDSTAPTSTVLYAYHLWKAQTHFGDTNNDGVVGVLDGATISASWTKSSPESALGPLGYKPQADLTGGTGGTTGSSSGLVVGIPDGKVSVYDSALVSAYWDGPPKGPSHP